MDAAADLTVCGAYQQPGLLLDLPDCGIGGRLAAADLARDERPRGLAVVAPTDENAEVAGHDRGDHRLWLGLGGFVRHVIALLWDAELLA